MKKLVLLIAPIYFSTQSANAQPRKLDPSFGINGTATTNIISSDKVMYRQFIKI